MSFKIKFAKPGVTPVLAMERPFGVLLDTEDQEWEDDDFVRRFCFDSMKAGCSWFLCFGPRAEAIHDRIDDFVVELGHDGIVTTYHAEESEEEVVEFFENVVLEEVGSGLIVVRDQSRWKRHFRAHGAEPGEGDAKPR